MSANSPAVFRRFFFAFLILPVLGAVPIAYAQDTLRTRHGDLLIGSVDRVTAEKIYFKTAFGASLDLKLSEVAKVSSPSGFLLNDIRNKNWRGQLVLDSVNQGMVGIRMMDSVLYFEDREIFELAKDQKKRFKDRFKLGVSLGYTRAKAQNTLGLSLGMNASYHTRRWDTKLDYQDYGAAVGANVVSRTSLDYSLAYILAQEWFFNGKASLYASSEQKIDIRRLYSVGIGKYLIHREAKVLSFSGGLVSNRETYLDNPVTYSSVEATINSHLSGKIGNNLDLTADWSVFPSFTQSGRVRNTLNLALKYLFLNHFNIGIHYVLNTDNKPPGETPNNDYVVEVKFGWSLNRK